MPLFANLTGREVTLPELYRAHAGAGEARPDDVELSEELERLIIAHVDWIPGAWKGFRVLGVTKPDVVRVLFDSRS